jgi:hypothetical protein
LRGNEVVLEKLEDNEASVRIKTHYFRLYQVTAHLRQWISFEDYKRLFETIWQDCARAAGWKLRIEYIDKDYSASECRLRFYRKKEGR